MRKTFRKTNIEFLRKLRASSAFEEVEARLKTKMEINFDTVFQEPLGCYLLKSYLASIFSLSKLIFASDVLQYRKLWSQSARLKVAKLIMARFILSENDRSCEESVFVRLKQFYNKYEKSAQSDDLQTVSLPKIIACKASNCINYADKAEIERIYTSIEHNIVPPTLFDNIYNEIYADFYFTVFPGFLKTKYYRDYVLMKQFERDRVTINDFECRYTLGHGAFGFVNAAHKKNSGHEYAIKCLNKKQVIASEQVDAVINEKTFLLLMDSPFVTGLKYSFSDKENLYLVLDLMPMGDLKQLLNRSGMFSEKLSRFYAAEILLGLQHIHDRGIIYRDIKLENILIDSKGHIKISDLGLSLKTKKTKGYAGTPGYTAPEVIRGDYYDKRADFFSLGVIIYRFLTGKKPFGEKGGDIDKNVLKIEPKYSQKFFSPDSINLIKQLLVKNPNKRLGTGENGIKDIMNHRWFDEIDFGLLDAGYIDPPWTPGPRQSLQEGKQTLVNHHRQKYKKIKITESFNKRFENFEFVNKFAVQAELVELMESLDREYVTNMERNLGEGHNRESKASAKCCEMM